MANGIQAYNIKDFTGGLNLVADTFRLADNESPDLLNVDMDRRGGFQVRRGVLPLIDGISGAMNPRTLHTGKINSTGYTIAQQTTSPNASKMYSTTGGSWSVITTATSQDTGNSTQDVCAVVFNNTAYWVRGNYSPIKWDGASSTSAVLLTSVFNDTTTPSSGNIPRANHMAVHAGYMWVAGTYESGTYYPNRVRFSWANTFDNSGENWRSADYIDIDDGKDSDAITAIIPFRDQLIVFKRDSVYAVYGYSAESFSVVNISNTVGTNDHSAAIATPAGLFFFDHQTGVHVYNGSNVNWVFEQIWPAMRDGSIPSTSIDNVRVGWIKQRLWVSVPWTDLPTVPRGVTFVFDPYVKSGGTWTKYDLQIGAYRRGHRTEDDVASLYGTNLVYKIDVDNQYYDNFGYELGIEPVDAWYRTRWIDLGQPAAKKRWKRMEAVLQVENPYNLPVVSYRNYDPTTPIKNFVIDARGVATATANAIWDDPASDWDNAKWNKEGTYGEIDRGLGLGVSRAISLKIGGKVLTQQTPTSPSAPAFWGIDALILKYIPRRLR